MKRMLLALVLLCPAVAHARLGKLSDGAQTEQVQISEYAESERQEKWMWLVGAIVAVGVGIYLWQQNQKTQKS